MAAERAGSSPGGQGKAVPVEETAVQLGLLGETGFHGDWITWDLGLGC